jgi:Lactoylglutathione lyase and related lyases
MIIGIDHFTINVVNLEKSIYFYEKILGLKQLNIINMGDHELIYFHLQEGCKLELIHYFYETDLCHPKENTQGIYRHMALKTDDVMEVYKKCTENDILIRLHPIVMDKLLCKGMLIEDPNGVEIEIVQKFV